MIQVLNGLTQNISSNKYQLGKNVQESILDKLPNTTKEELLHVSLSEFLKFICCCCSEKNGTNGHHFYIYSRVDLACCMLELIFVLLDRLLIWVFQLYKYV